MTFKKLLTLAAAIMMAGSTWAQGWTPSEVAEGDFYLYNVGAKAYLVGANSWGTQASVSTTGGILTSLAGSDDSYTISTGADYKNCYLGANGYVDNGTAATWVFAAVDGKTNTYTLYNETFGYIVATDGNTVLSASEEEPTTDYGYWKLVSKANRIADLANATAETPIDATFLISDPNFGRNQINTAWTIVASNKNLSGGANDNCCAESWRSSFTLSQNISLPNGFYKLTAQAALTEYTVTGEDFPVVYINDETAKFKTMENGENSMSGMSAQFTSGNYVVGPIDVKIVSKSATVGVKGTRTDTWCIWDNFVLSYEGPLDLSEYVTAFNAALGAAKAVDQDAPMNATVLADLKDAIAAYDGEAYDNSDEYEAAISELLDNTDAATASIAEYEKIAEYNAKAATLVGDAATSAYADVLAAYNDRSATESSAAKDAYLAALKLAEPEVNITDLAPASWTGASGTVAAAFMLEPEYVGIAERYKSGAFTGDVMTQTITGLQNGTYKVILHGGASYTSGRGFEGATGQNHAYFFANDALQSLEVYDRTVIGGENGPVEEAVLICGVSDGTLKYGIQNITTGANWFVVDLESITFTSTSLPAQDVALEVGESGYATFVAPFEYDVPAGVKAYTVDDVDADAATLILSELTTVPKNTPVVLTADAAVSVIVSGVNEAEGLTATAGLLTGTYGDLEITEGYVLQNQAEDGVKFYAVSAENPKTVPAFHAYLTVPEGSEVKAFGFDAIATAIKNIEVAKAAQNGAIFNLAGQQLSGLQKGINIVNGKKVLVK